MKNTNGEPKKILLVDNYMLPYRVQLNNEIAKSVDLTALYEFSKDKIRDEKWKNGKAEFKFSVANTECDRVDVKYDKKFMEKQCFSSYDCILIEAYNCKMSIKIMSYLKKNNIDFIINADGGFKKSKENPLKRIYKRHLLKQASMWITSGEYSSEYLKFYGAKTEFIRYYPFAFNYPEDIMLPSQEEKQKIKNKLNIKYDKVILTVSRFVEIKGNDILLKACQGLDDNIGIYLVGGFPTLEYTKLKEDLKLDNVNFIDFMPSVDLEEYYKMADLFVLPTRADVWGLVINEAMAKSLPIITTNKCIAGIERVIPGENGFLVEVDDICEIHNKIKLLFKDENLLTKISNNNFEKMKKFTILDNANRHCEIFQEFCEIFD